MKKHAAEKSHKSSKSSWVGVVARSVLVLLCMWPSETEVGKSGGEHVLILLLEFRMCRMLVASVSDPMPPHTSKVGERFILHVLQLKIN